MKMTLWLVIMVCAIMANGQPENYYPKYLLKATGAKMCLVKKKHKSRNDSSIYAVHYFDKRGNDTFIQTFWWKSIDDTTFVQYDSLDRPIHVSSYSWRHNETGERYDCDSHIYAYTYEGPTLTEANIYLRARWDHRSVIRRHCFMSFYYNSDGKLHAYEEICRGCWPVGAKYYTYRYNADTTVITQKPDTAGNYTIVLLVSDSSGRIKTKIETRLDLGNTDVTTNEYSSTGLLTKKALSAGGATQMMSAGVQKGPANGSFMMIKDD